MELSDVTFLIKSFLRPNCLSRLLLSIHRYYPCTPTIVVDDSGNDDAKFVCNPYPKVTLIQTKKDIGSSHGRNIGLFKVQTKYFVLLDDDNIFWIMTDISLMKRKLEETGSDIVCGPYCVPNKGEIQQSAMTFLKLENRNIIVKENLPLGEEGWVKASENFFIARTKLRERVLWPENIKTNEHATFFWLVHQIGGKVWASHYSSILHDHLSNKKYDRFRNRLKTSKKHRETIKEFQKKHSCTYFTGELLKEFGEQYGDYQLRWKRILPPRCRTEKKFLELYKQNLT